MGKNGIETRGLSGPDSRKLNLHGLREPDEIQKNVREMKEKYSDDPLALQQIDMYDPKSPHQERMRLYKEAMKAGDTERERECEEWLVQNYPLLYRSSTT